MTTPLDHLDLAAMRQDLMTLLEIPSMGGTPAEVEVQEHLARSWRDDGLVVDRWDIDVEGSVSYTHLTLPTILRV